MTTAFQPDAFQNNAFQIDIDGGAGSGTASGSSGRKKKRRGLTQADINDLLEEYRIAQTAKIDNETQRKIISTINPFVYPESEQEIERSQKAQFLFDTLPPVERIDFNVLSMNLLSLEKLKSAISQVRAMQEEEELCLLLLLASY